MKGAFSIFEIKFLKGGRSSRGNKTDAERHGISILEIQRYWVHKLRNLAAKLPRKITGRMSERSEEDIFSIRQEGSIGEVLGMGWRMEGC